MRTIKTHRVRRAMTQDRTVAGVSLVMFGVVAGLAFLTWLFTASFAGTALVGGLAFTGAYATRNDPKMLHIWWNSWFMKDYYDAAKDYTITVVCE